MSMRRGTACRARVFRIEFPTLLDYNASLISYGPLAQLVEQLTLNQ